MAGSTLQDIIRGAAPLARFIFKDERKRRLIPQLQKQGWPIFDLAGKPSGFPADLAAHARKATRKAQNRRRAGRGKRRSKIVTEAAASTATA